MALCYLGLGGNVGDVVATMDAALDRLDAHSEMAVRLLSRVYETAPVGVDAGGRFLNAAAAIQTDLAPEQLMHHLKAVERELGRTATDRWSERLIDLDLLLVDGEMINRPRLVVPHPHLWYRRFVLDPLVQIAGDLVHPQLNEPLCSLRSRLTQRPLHLALAGGNPSDGQEAAAVLGSYEPAVIVHAIGSRAAGGEEPATDFEGGTHLGFLDAVSPVVVCRRWINLSLLPGTLSDAARSVMTAALDEPRAYSRPLRRMP